MSTIQEQLESLRAMADEALWKADQFEEEHWDELYPKEEGPMNQIETWMADESERFSKEMIGKMRQPLISNLLNRPMPHGLGETIRKIEP